MNTMMLAFIGIAEVFVVLLVLLVMAGLAVGVVLLTVWLVRRGSGQASAPLASRREGVPLAGGPARLSFFETRGGRVQLRWGIYTLGLVLVLVTSALLNGLLLAAGVWSGADTVLFGLLAGAVIFNIIVIYDFNRAVKAMALNPPATGNPPPTENPPPPSPTPSASCPRCGAPLPTHSPQGLCPPCVMGVGLAAQTEAPGELGPHGTRITKPTPKLEELAVRFPHLEILECLGRGGMGVVYKARQPKLNRLIALKILAPEKGADPKFAERFQREAQALARLSHPNIVTVHDFGEADGMFFLIMEHVDGMTLRHLLREGHLKPEEALAIVPKVCEALQFAHEQGIVHRDIKPENVLLDKQGRVKIADFGIAKILGGTPPAPSLPPSDGERTAARPGEGSLTQDQILGTPHYMAPEQVEKPQCVDHRADIYSLGVVFYEMLTGELPLGKFQPPSKKVQVDVRLDEVVLHALEKEPERRYQHASEVKTDVENIRSSATTPRPSVADRRCRIPGTNLFLVEARGGQRLVNWANVCVAWILLMLAGLLALGTTAVVANLTGFYLAAAYQTIVVAMAFVAAFALTVVVRRALLLPASADETLPTPVPGHETSAATIRCTVESPANWLVATGILNWIGIPFLVFVLASARSLPFPHVGQAPVLLPLLALLVLSSAIILAGLKMKRLEGYSLAITGSVLAIFIAPGNIIGLPVGIWSLVVLSRREVREAFGKAHRLPPDSLQPRSRRGAWKLVAVLIAAGLLVLAVPAGCTMLALYYWKLGQAHPEAVVRVEEKLRNEIQTRLSEGGWKPDSLSVSVSPDLKRAECRFGRIWKNGLSQEPPLRAAIRLQSQGNGLWQVRGEGEFGSLRFSVDTSAEMKARQVEPPPAVALVAKFGPMREATLNDMDDYRGSDLLDLDSGRTLNLNREFEKWPLEQQAVWLRTNGVDLMLDRAQGRWGLITPQGRETRLVLVTNAFWEALGEAEFERELNRPDPGVETLRRQDITVHLLATNAQPPLTFAFATANGTQGMLQITSWAMNPNRLSLRFKLASGKGLGSGIFTIPSPTPDPVVILRDNMALDLDAGALLETRRETNHARLATLDVAWDNDGGGALMRNPLGTTRLLPLPDVENFQDAAARASERRSLVASSEDRAEFAGK